MRKIERDEKDREKKRDIYRERKRKDKGKREGEIREREK